MSNDRKPLITTQVPQDSPPALTADHGLYVLGRNGFGPNKDGVLDFGVETIYDDERDGEMRQWALSFDGERDPATGVLVPTGVSVRPAAPDPANPVALDAVLLRKLPIRIAYATALESRVGWTMPVEGSSTYPQLVGGFELPVGAVEGGIPRSGISQDMLALVSRVYYLARLIGRPPMQAVQQTFGAPRAKANFWLNRAREDGLIGESPTHRAEEREYREPLPVSVDFAVWLLETSAADLASRGMPEGSARRAVGLPSGSSSAAPAAEADAEPGVRQRGSLEACGVTSPSDQGRVYAEFERRGISRADVDSMSPDLLSQRLVAVLESLGMKHG